MKLRQWQSECVERALDHFEASNKHFLCLATPGAGKTVMAAEIAGRLHEQNLIDFVLCFSPSINVSQSIQITFSHRFNCRFDGVIGAIGCSYTYQNMLFFKSDFWQILKHNRVLVIFDEIHHCAGTTPENANAWGEEIILNIQSQAQYTLALTGTPWRSDNAPIVLSRYLDPDRQIQCDYVYGLKEAVRDSVCRNPKIVLIDNEKLSVTNGDNQTKTFTSFKDLLNDSFISYQSIITNDTAIRYILSLGCKKLSEIRQSNPNAGGLVVASSIEHASHIIRILRDEFYQTAELVTYKQPSPSETIDQFRCSHTEWIVSIGMVSEGTDIPRLQVCCHLSKVKTELYFRQILGRILRVNNAITQEAWLYTFADPQLTDFAHRIEQELPDIPVIIKETIDEITSEQVTLKRNRDKHALQTTATTTLDIGFDLTSSESRSDQAKQLTSNQVLKNSTSLCSFEFLGGFREKVITTFDSPF
ncbi:GGDEF domain protein [Photobacterium marinum]|uniref:GGDEF domain protein n=1 Tax=Photobacterium marinum TaxID=1056511 RepID=L8JI66_9GAMM|nr:DEAD/DEAH box helicase family protein [Photobacterium marinum]ELR67179.1 GGDEF domain protein [Photobacterium marinum]